MKDRNALTVILAAAAVLLFSGCRAVNGLDPISNVPADNAGSGEKTEGDINGRKYLPSVEEIVLDDGWKYAEHAVVNTGAAVLYRASENGDAEDGLPAGKDPVIAVNAGHGTVGGEEKEVYCHPDKTPKLTKGSNPKGSLKAVAVAAGMIFADGTTEAEAALRVARMLRERLLDDGYDVLMIRDDQDVQLDNVARTVIANNKADCLVSLHFDGDGMNYDKGCFYIPVPDEIKGMDPVSDIWREHERLGEALLKGLRKHGCRMYDGRIDALELTQTCYATIPAVVVELGNAKSDISDAQLKKTADGLADGIEAYFGK